MVSQSSTFVHTKLIRPCLVLNLRPHEPQSEHFTLCYPVVNLSADYNIYLITSISNLAQILRVQSQDFFSNLLEYFETEFSATQTAALGGVKLRTVKPKGFRGLRFGDAVLAVESTRLLQDVSLTLYNNYLKYRLRYFKHHFHFNC